MYNQSLIKEFGKLKCSQCGRTEPKMSCLVEDAPVIWYPAHIVCQVCEQDVGEEDLLFCSVDCFWVYVTHNSFTEP